MNRLGVAVVGLGVGAAHARAFASLPACELRWLHDLDPHRAEHLAAELGCGAPAAAFEAMVQDPLVDIVAIASYDDAHCRQVVASLLAGKHVFVEKPLARTPDELRQAKATWQQSRRHLASNLVLRSAPLYRWLKRAVDEGVFGDVYAFDGDYLYGRIHKITDEWRKDVEDYSVMAGGGIHLVDLMLWLTGGRPSRVSASGNRVATRNSAFRYRDFVAATFEFDSGLVGRVTANFGCVHPHQHVVRVFGTRATFVVDDRGPRLYDSRNPRSAPRLLDEAPLPASKGDLIPAFVESVLAGGDANQTRLDFDVLSACAAADRAVDTGAATEVIYY